MKNVHETTLLGAYEPAPDELRDRVILVTGAGDGIGKAVSLACARYGATVILLGRTVKKLEAVYDAIVEQGAPQPAIYPLDLQGATPEHYEQLADNVANEFQRLDGLLHNAARLGPLTPMDHFEPEEWARVFQVNVHAPFVLTRACLALLKNSKDARIVFTVAETGPARARLLGRLRGVEGGRRGDDGSARRRARINARPARQQHRPRPHPHAPARRRLPGREPQPSKNPGRRRRPLRVSAGTRQRGGQRGQVRDGRRVEHDVPRRSPL